MNNRGESGFIQWIQARWNQASANSPGVILGPGDDCAILQPSQKLQLVTTDMLMDGVDFLLSRTEPRLAGRKCLAVNLSDIAAMAGVPRFALISIALPRGAGTESLARELYEGIEALAREFDVALVGGDTNTWPHPLAVSITLLGEAAPGGPVRRSGAEPGDWLFVTGPLGGSIRGHHLHFMPRVREAQALAAEVNLKAMIDISDGLAVDLHHILEASGCGAVLDAAAIPKNSTLEAALGDGEDFELLFAVSPEDGRKLLSRPDLWKIGHCIEDGMWLDDHGNRRAFEPVGWQHDFDDPPLPS